MFNRKGFALYYFTCFTLFSVITPNLQLFLESQGWDYTMIGFLQGVYQLVGVAGPLFIGGLADRTGRYRPFLLAGYLCLIPAFFLMGRTGPVFMAILLIGIIGIALKSIVPLSDTLLSHSLDDPEKDYGKLRIWGSIGFLSCSFFLDYSGIFEQNFQRSFLRMILITAVLSILSLMFLPSSRKQGAAESRKKEKDEKIPAYFWLLMTVLFIAWFANSAYFSFYSLFLKEMTSISKLNIQWGLGALFEIPLMFLSGYLLQKRGLKPLLLATLVVLSLRLGLYGLVLNPVVLTLSQILHALTFGLLHSLSVASVNRFIPPGKKAAAMALYSAVIRGGSAFLGSTLGGWISEQWGLQKLFGVYSLIPLLAIGLLLFVPGHLLERKRAPEALHS